MTTKQSQLVRTAIRLWSNPYVPKEINRHNQRQWLKSVGFLGDNWLLRKRIDKLTTPRD